MSFLVALQYATMRLDFLLIGTYKDLIRECKRIGTVAGAMKLIETSKPTATRAVQTLITAGILVETTGKKRDRSFAYQAYVEQLRIGTELEEHGRRPYRRYMMD